MSEHHSDLERLVGPDRRNLLEGGWLSGSILAIGMVLLVGLIVLWPRGEANIDFELIGFADDTAPGRVEASEEGACSYAPDFRCNRAEVVITGGPHEGEQVLFEFPDDRGQPHLATGDRVFLTVVDLPDGTAIFQYADRDRRILLGVLALIFGTAVVGLGRLKGVAALSGLVISIGVLLVFILPAIVRGTDAMLVALVGGGVIAMVTLYLAHGYNPFTHAAALGTFAALTLTVLLSWLVVGLASFSGLTGDDAFFLIAIPDLDLSGVVLAGIVLGALGALDDVTVTQASAVWEVHEANPELGPERLFQAGVRVGRNHIVSTVNTLLLAYAGASLPLLILFSVSAQAMGVIASSEVVAVEIVRTLVGSMGLVAAVPITTWLAARIASRGLSPARHRH
jgi:uncharacterized membrane protein